MSAIDAFHMRQVALDGIRTPWWHHFSDNYVDSLNGKAKDGTAPYMVNEGGTVPEWLSTGKHFTDSVHSMLTMGETFYIAPGMHALVAAAAEEWIDDEPVQPEDLPTDSGFLWMPGAGLATIDIRGQVMHTNAMTWQRRGDVIRIVMWAHKRHDPPNIRAKPGWESLVDLTPWHCTEQPLGAPILQTVQLGTLLPPEISDAISYVPSPDGRGLSMLIPQGWSPEELMPSLRVNAQIAWLVSMWRIMQQEIAHVSRTGLPANVRRQYAKHPRRLKQTAVTIIEFRRVKGDYVEGSGRTYSHRFLRRGHWRRQPYKRDDGTWDRRRIYIHPTIVGDPDKPLILRNHVQALMR